MQNGNDIAMVQDTSTQAMTEVALGLSMAFFALLIIALMSVTLPSSTNNSIQIKNKKNSVQVDISQQVVLSVQDTQSEQVKETESQGSTEVILLYWRGQFFNTQQQIVNIDNANMPPNVIVAVSPQIPFNKLIDVQAKFAGKALRLTKLDEQWQRILSEAGQSEILPTSIMNGQ